MSIQTHLLPMALSGMGSELHSTSKAMNIGQNVSEMAAPVGFVACVTSISHIYKERLDDSELKNAGYTETK
jgi:hypothetical protein